MNKLLLTCCLVFWTMAAHARHYDLSAQRLSAANGLPTNVVSRIWQDGQGYMCFETQVGLCRYDGYVIQTIGKENVEVPQEAGKLLTLDARWQREGQGRLARHGTDGTVRSWQLIAPEIIAYTKNDHFHVADVDERTEAISTYGSGLYLYDKPTGELTQLTKENTRGLLDDNYLTGLYVDRTGCIWLIEDYLGIKCLRMNQLNYRPLWIEEHARIQDRNHIRCIAPIGKQDWLVSNQMGEWFTFNLDVSGNISLKKSRAISLPFGSLRVYAALLDSQNHLWIGTRGGGLWRDGLQVEGLPSPHIFNIRETVDGNILVSMLEGGVLVIKPDGERVLMLKGRNVHDAKHLTLGPSPKGAGSGCLVVAAEDGLFFLNDKGETADSLTGYFSSLHIDGKGCVWAGSIDGGLVEVTFKDSIIRTARYLEGEGAIYSIIPDKVGHLWIGTEDGLRQMDLTTHEVTRYRTGESALSNVFCERAAASLPDGRLLFGSHNGLVEITPTKSVKWEPPTTAVTGFVVNGERIAVETPLSYRQNNLTLQFSNFQYAHMGSVRYQYLLEGHNSEWSMPTTQPVAVYRDLPPGRYVFHVRSCVGGTWGKETTVPLRILQPWWNTWWAWCLYIIIIIVTCWGAVRIHRLRRRLKEEREASAKQQVFYAQVERELLGPVNVVQGATENVQLSGTSKTTVRSLRRGARRIVEVMERIRTFNQPGTVGEQQQSHVSDASPDGKDEIKKEIPQEEFRELAPPPINDQTVLIVDGDEDSLSHLTDTLNPYFRIIGVRTAESAMSLVRQEQPEVVIIDTDVQGALTLTQQIVQEDAERSVIHLSSTISESHRQQCLEAGAADYIVKPFSSKDLVEHVGQALDGKALTDLKAKKFLDQLQVVLFAHVSDENFSVEQWAGLMGLKRVQFYKKVKTLTGETPVQHLHRARLDYAARLLRESRDTIEEVMLRAGFHSATHFYNAFKKQFGLSPRDYRRRQ